MHSLKDLQLTARLYNDQNLDVYLFKLSIVQLAGICVGLSESVCDWLIAKICWEWNCRPVGLCKKE